MHYMTRLNTPNMCPSTREICGGATAVLNIYGEHLNDKPISGYINIKPLIVFLRDGNCDQTERDADMRHKSIQVSFSDIAVKEPVVFHEGFGHFEIIREQGPQVKREEHAFVSVCLEHDGQWFTKVAWTTQD